MDFDGICLIKDNIVIGINKYFQELIGMDKSELVGKNILNIIEEDEYNKFIQNKSDSSLLQFKGKKECILKSTYTDINDKFIQISVKYPDNFLKEEYDFLLRTSSVAIIKRNVTKAWRILDEVAKRTNNIQSFVLNNDYYDKIRSSINYISINDAAVELFGGKSKKHVLEYLSSTTTQTPKSYLISMVYIYETTTIHDRFIKVKTLDGVYKEVLAKSRVFGTDNKILVTTIIDTSNIQYKPIDIFERNLKKLFDEVPIGLALHSNRYLTDCNSRFIKMFGYSDKSEVIGLHVDFFIAPKFRKRVKYMYEGRITGKNYIPSKYIIDAIRKDNSIFPVELNSVVVAIKEMTFNSIMIIDDISERIAMERDYQSIQSHLANSHKLESLGVFSGGIAHDFNNILQVFYGSLDILIESNELSEYNIDVVKDMKSTAQTARELIDQLLTYSGKSVVKPEIIKLDMFKLHMQTLLKVMIPSNITIDFIFNQIDSIYIDKSQLTQLMINLIMNASEAINNDFGQITVLMRDEYIKINELEGHIISLNDNFDGNYNILSVSDNGTGISKENINKIIDPFFTSKPTGRGLGLSVVQGIVTQYNGFIEIKTKIDKGTSFNIYLPSISDNKNEIEDTKKLDEQLLSPSGTILIVDDEEVVVRVLTRMLRKLNFNVVSVDNGFDAKDKILEFQDISCVILDLNMPVIDGIETFYMINKIKPELPVIISSGYLEDKLDAIKDKVGFLHKPYDIVALIKLLQSYFN